MITEQTTFITGAGASYGYGFPLGTELVSHIVKSLENFSAGILGRQALDSIIGRDSIQISYDFLRRLAGAQPYSIDLFLENNPDLEKIGKFLIAFIIIRSEKPSFFDAFNIQIMKEQNHWLGFLWGKMLERVKSVEDFKKNKVSFITFNYDRTLEYFFTERIKNFFKKNYPEAVEIAKSINIIHLYGSLGGYDSLNPADKHYLKYELNADANRFLNKSSDIFHWSNSIHVIDSRNELETFEEAYKILKKSHAIYILGFGYDDINIERLKLVPVIGRGIPTFSTSIGILPGKYSKIRSIFNDKIHTDANHKILDLLQIQF